MKTFHVGERSPVIGDASIGDARQKAVKVLIVDTDVQNVQQLGAALRKRGYEPLEATSFEAAKSLWVAEHPPMIIADVRLGQFNGLQLLIRARIDRPDVKVVITCAYPDSVLEAETRRLGGTFLLKPLGPDEIVAAISRVTQEVDTTSKPQSVGHRIGERRQVKIQGFAPERRIADRRRGDPAAR